MSDDARRTRRLWLRALSARSHRMTRSFMVVFIAWGSGCSTPLHLHPDFGAKTYDVPETTHGLSAEAPPPRDAQPIDRLDLQVARDLCLQRNHSVAAARAAVEAARARIFEARSALLPRLTVGIQRTVFDQVRSVEIPGTGASFSLSPATQTTGSAQLTLSLFAFGRDLEAVNAARADLSTQMFDERSSRQLLLYEVTQAWYRLAEATAQVQVADDALKSAEQQETDAVNLFAAERVTPEAVPTARVEVLRRKQESLVASNAVVHARRILNVLLAREVDAPLTLADAGEFAPVAMAQEALIALAREHNPRVLAFRTRRLALDHRRESLARSWAPELVGSLQADYTDFRGATGYSTNYSATIGWQWTPVDAGRRIGRMNELHALMVQNREEELQAIQQLELDLRKAFLDVSEFESAATLAREAIVAARESHRIVTDRFNVGKTTAREVLEAQTTLANAQFSFNQARFAQRTHLARVEALVGVLRGDWPQPSGAP